MTDYGFPKKGEGASRPPELERLPRGPVPLDADREADALRRGEGLGFVNREPSSDTEANVGPDGPVRRRRGAVPTKSIFIKGPKPIIDWFIEFSNRGGYDAYWEALRALKERYDDHQPGAL
ncbi:MAG: hypothetical protein K2W86_18075 [Sphingomonas sp.]|uniref:hypothetical protein n=1 Tax=Sphingomonas sp. TaxID=28214 RepID=UPI0035A9A3B0|nr:hypothetical protein [Sphingomonas sp.]